VAASSLVCVLVIGIVSIALAAAGPLVLLVADLLRTIRSWPSVGLFALLEVAGLSSGIAGAVHAAHSSLALTVAGAAASGVLLLASGGSAALGSVDRKEDSEQELERKIGFKPIPEAPVSGAEIVRPEPVSTDLAVKDGSLVRALTVPDNASVVDYLPSSSVYAAGNTCLPRLVGGARYDIPASTQGGKLECRVVVNIFHDGAAIWISAKGKVWRGLFWRKGSPRQTFTYYVRCDSGTDGCVLVGSFIGQQRVSQGSVTIEVRAEQRVENGILQANFTAWAGLLPSSIPDLGFTPVNVGGWPSAKVELPVSVGSVSWKCEPLSLP
jgi:hypothetical protein